MRLVEISTIATGRSAVDREAGVIRGVKILGRESKNGRTYSERALKEAASKYEGVDVNVNHPDRKAPNSERRIEDAIGWIESVEVRKDGVYGDLHYLREHPSSGLVAEAAERRSNRFGLSHNAQGTVKNVKGKNVVESIERVISVDLVQNPATNSGLFESAGRTIREALKQHAPSILAALVEDAALLPPETMDEPMMAGVPAEPEADPSAEVKAALVQMLTAVVEMPGDITSICTQLISVAQKIMAGQPKAESEPTEDGEADPNAPEAEAEGETDPEAAAEEPADEEADDSANPFAKRKRPMAEQAHTPKTVEQRLALMEQQNRELREELDLRKLKDQCETLLREAKREVTGTRLTALANMPDDAARLQLIEEWPAIPEPEPTTYRKPKPSFSAPLREQKHEAKYPTSIKEFVDACR